MSSTRESHLSESVVAAYLDGQLDAVARREASAHLARCATCRAELVEAERAMRDLPRASRPLATLALLAAAAVVAIVAWPAGAWRTGARDIAMRGETAPRRKDSSAFGLVAPNEGVTLERGRVRFAWHALGAGASYHLAIMDAEGAPVWSTTIADTLADPPDSVSFRSGAHYYWMVDARAADGRTISGGVRRFTTP